MLSIKQELLFVHQKIHFNYLTIKQLTLERETVTLQQIFRRGVVQQAQAVEALE